MGKKYNNNGILIRRYNYNNVDESKLRNPTSDEIRLFSRTYEYLINERIKKSKKMLVPFIIIFLFLLCITFAEIFSGGDVFGSFFFGIISLLMLVLICDGFMTINSEKDLLNNIRNGNFKLLDLICGSDIDPKIKNDFSEVSVAALYTDKLLFQENVRTARGGLDNGLPMYLVYVEYNYKSKKIICDNIITPYMLSDEGYKSVVVIDHKTDSYVSQY